MLYRLSYVIQHSASSVAAVYGRCHYRLSTNPAKQISSRFPGDFQKTF